MKINEKIENSLMSIKGLSFVALTGSYAYNLNNENSDIDIRGFFILSIDEKLGIKQKRNHEEVAGIDEVIYNKYC